MTPPLTSQSILNRKSSASITADRIAAKAVVAIGFVSVLSLLMIFVFLAREALSFFSQNGIAAFFSGTSWHPISEPASFGIFPLIAGTLLVSVTAVAIALPVGVAAAIYISEVAPHSVKELLKPAVELLASIPSIVIGFIGSTIVAYFIKDTFGLPTGLTALTGAVMLAMMAIPTIISISEDALNTVPDSYREASFALGANRWETIIKVTVPAARRGIIAAVMIGFGRIIGETMAVMMLTGNAAVIPHSLLDPVRTMTATIAAEMGETVHGSDHYKALFAIGAALFVMTFVINLAADLAVNGRRKTA